VVTLPGDVTVDGIVDCRDLSTVKAAYGKRVGAAGFDARADTNGDGVVDIRDLSFVAQKLPVGTTCP
jgi:trimeric autotransporter adhesin